MKLLLLTVHDEGSVTRSVMAAGADGLVLKRAIASDLLPGVDRLLAGENYLSPASRRDRSWTDAGRIKSSTFK